MQIRQFALAFALLTPMFLAACSDDEPTATSPTAPTPPAVVETPFALNAITSVPDGAGVQFNTDFQFTAQGSFPTGTQFVWRFGDGSSTTTNTPTASRVFGQAGVFDVTVEARTSSASATAVKPTSVRSLVGRWFGTMTGHTKFPRSRPQAITSFELQVTQHELATDGRSVVLHGRWADDAGCRETRVEFLRQLIQPEPAARVTFGVNNLSCADGDFYLTGIADALFNNVEGHCDVSGGNPNCRFSMRRQ